MTDTRLPEQWLFKRELDRLSDQAWRILTRAMMYCNSQGTDGEIDQMYLHLLYPWGDPKPHFEEIVAIGWMVPTATGYLILDWEGRGQTTAAEMAANREKNRVKQQKSRANKKAALASAVPGDVPSDVPSDVPGDVGQARHKDRTGEASDMKVSWPVVQIPTKESDLTIREGEIL